MSVYDTPYYFTGNGTEPSINPSIPKEGDFKPFYIAIAIGSAFIGALILLNIYCCCSRYSDYWLDRHTGNRWIVSIWSATPHKQPPLDLSELVGPFEVRCERRVTEQYQDDFPPSVSHQPLTSSQEYLELQRRESHI